MEQRRQLLSWGTTSARTLPTQLLSSRPQARVTDIQRGPGVTRAGLLVSSSLSPGHQPRQTEEKQGFRASSRLSSGAFSSKKRSVSPRPSRCRGWVRCLSSELCNCHQHHAGGLVVDLWLSKFSTVPGTQHPPFERYPLLKPHSGQALH